MIDEYIAYNAVCDPLASCTRGLAKPEPSGRALTRSQRRGKCRIAGPLVPTGGLFTKVN